MNVTLNMGKTLRKIQVESLNRRELHSQLLYTYCWRVYQKKGMLHCRVCGRQRRAGGATWKGVQICRDSFLLPGLFTVFSLQFPLQLVTFFSLPLPFSVYLSSIFFAFLLYYYFWLVKAPVLCGSVSSDFTCYLCFQNTQKEGEEIVSA